MLLFQALKLKVYSSKQFLLRFVAFLFMNWIYYKKSFLSKAKDLSEEQINWCLSYSEPLIKNGLPLIYDPEHLSKLIGISLSYFERLIQNKSKFYKKYYIKKRSGKKRYIAEPLPNLKIAQNWILKNLLSKLKNNDYIKSYIPKRSIIDNARFHRNQDMVLNLDISSYFENIKEESVFSFFLNLGYNRIVAKYLTAITTLEMSLPQGAPTSPLLSNLITSDIDISIANYCKSSNNKKFRYTRYADDLTFSGSFTPSKVIFFIKELLIEHGFELNYSKIRVRRKHQRQIVTGIIVNKKLSIPNNKKRELRQAIYYIEKFGLENHLKKKKITQDNYLNHLLGKCYFYISIEPKNTDLKMYIKILKNLIIAST